MNTRCSKYGILGSSMGVGKGGPGVLEQQNPNLKVNYFPNCLLAPSNLFDKFFVDPICD